MSEIININIGQAGVRIANHFWSTLRNEHAINSNNPIGNASVFFQEKSKGWESRSIFIDLDKREIDKLTAQKDCLYNENDLISLNATSRGLYAESSYHIFPELNDDIMDRVRRKTEACDCFGGFIFLSTLGGGTSSGLGNRVSEEVRQNYPERMNQSFKLLPDLANAHPLEIYNCTHALHKQVEFQDLSVLFDNAWIERMVTREGLGRGIQAGNKWVAKCIAESTIPFRFSGGLNTNQRKIATNLVLFPRLHFFPFSSAPSLSAALRPDLLSLTNYYSEGGKIFSIYAGVRDALSSEQEADNTIRAEMGRHQLQFVDWIENQSHLSLHDPVTHPSATFMVSSYNMRQYFARLGQKFASTFRRRGFVCWYRGAGLDQFQFTEMESNINDIASEYTSYEYFGAVQDEEYQSDMDIE